MLPVCRGPKTGVISFHSLGWARCDAKSAGRRWGGTAVIPHYLGAKQTLVFCHEANPLFDGEQQWRGVTGPGLLSAFDFGLGLPPDNLLLTPVYQQFLVCLTFPPFGFFLIWSLGFPPRVTKQVQPPLHPPRLRRFCLRT